MEAYSEFAQVYDLFMDNIPYEEWCDYLVTLLKKYGVVDGLVLELGCGTGSMTEALRRRGYRKNYGEWRNGTNPLFMSGYAEF